ncbi:hypothetical protein VPHD527_0377 [Vibrio phage D527]
MAKVEISKFSGTTILYEQYTMSLLETREYVHSNQVEKLKEMDKLMFDCWRKGYKRSKILELAQKIESNTTEDDVQIYFRNMFTRELSSDSIYLKKENLLAK